MSSSEESEDESSNSGSGSEENSESGSEASGSESEGSDESEKAAPPPPKLSVSVMTDFPQIDPGDLPAVAQTEAEKRHETISKIQDLSADLSYILTDIKEKFDAQGVSFDRSYEPCMPYTYPTYAKPQFSSASNANAGPEIGTSSKVKIRWQKSELPPTLASLYKQHKQAKRTQKKKIEHNRFRNTNSQQIPARVPEQQLLNHSANILLDSKNFSPHRPRNLSAFSQTHRSDYSNFDPEFSSQNTGQFGSQQLPPEHHRFPAPQKHAQTQNSFPTLHTVQSPARRNSEPLQRTNLNHSANFQPDTSRDLFRPPNRTPAIVSTFRENNPQPQINPAKSPAAKFLAEHYSKIKNKNPENRISSFL